MSLARPISRFWLVKNKLHPFPPSVPGPRAQLDPGGLKDWHGEGEAFFLNHFLVTESAILRVRFALWKPVH